MSVTLHALRGSTGGGGGGGIPGDRPRIRLVPRTRQAAGGTRPLAALTGLAALLFAGCHHLSTPSGSGTSSTPNVVIVFTDDQGWADVGYQGAQGFDTPHIDRLAAGGRVFTDFYVAQPVCSASRAALLTGCYPNRIGIHGALGPGSKNALHPDETTLAEVCRSLGYATAMFGKWHLGHRPESSPLEHGFDEFYGIPYSNDMWPGHPESPKAWGNLPTFEGHDVVAYNGDQRRFTGDFTRRAVSFIERSVAEARPFFLYLAHPMPHVPLFTSDDFAGSSEQGAFGDVIQEIDWSVGEIVSALEREGQLRNTLVLFSSDNGPWLSYGDHAGSTGPLREGKGTTFEGGVRVPFVASWPGRIPAGTSTSEPAMTIDVLPTVVELLGADAPELEIDGKSMTPLLLGQPGARSPQDAYYFWYHRNQLEAMRVGRWKLHFPHGYRSMQGRELGTGGIPGKYDHGVRIGLELFDLQEDVGESTDVSAQHPEVMERLIALADEKRRELGDRLSETEGTSNRQPAKF